MGQVQEAVGMTRTTTTSPKENRKMDILRQCLRRAGVLTEIYECPEGGWGIMEIDGIHYLTRKGIVQRRITEEDFGYAELIKHICPLHDVELIKR